MNLYADSSALVKRYLTESGSTEVDALFNEEETVGTALIARAELAAALSKAVRIKALTQVDAHKSLQEFRSHWSSLTVIQVTETLIALADTLAWEHGLRSYDAVHLAAALTWQEAEGESVRVATFDRQLWQAAQTVGLEVWPETLENKPIV